MSLHFASSAPDWRRPAWIAALTVASMAFTLGFACATPFAAFAALAALTMPRRDALLLVGLVWFANQAVGFGVLHYPWTVSSIGWGFGLAAAALLACLAAQACADRLAKVPAFAASALAFLVAFAAYEGALYAFAIVFQSGEGAFTGEIVARIFAINAAAFAGLLIVNRLGAAAGLIPQGAASPVALAR